MNDEILSPIDDWIFKLLFGDERNKSMLTDFLSSFVELPEEEYELSFLDSYLKPEAVDDKLGIVDVKVKTASGKIINIEIQVNPVHDIGKRLSFYKSKLIVEQIGKHELYDVIQKVICICIMDYRLFPSVKEYINSFKFYNPVNGLLFEDMPEELYTLELPKVPHQDDKSEVWGWLQFLRARSKEEFEMAAEKNPEIRRAVDVLYEVSADDMVRAEYEQRLKAWRDRHSQNQGFYKKGIQEGIKEGIQEGIITTARNALARGFSPETVHDITGLDMETISKIISDTTKA